MARASIVSAAGITLANRAVTLVFTNPSATVGFDVLRCWVGQSAGPTSAQQRVQLVSQITAFPTLTSATPSKVRFGDPVSGIVGGAAGAAGTAGVNASAEGAGTKVVILNDAFNVVNGWVWVPTPDERLVFGGGIASGFGLHLPVAPATLTNWAFGVTYREIN